MKKKYIPIIFVGVGVLAYFFNPLSVVAATFGVTGNNASTQTNSTDRKYVNSATPATSGTVTAGAARIWNTGSVNSNSRLVIYTNTSGTCDTSEVLLAQSDEVVLSTGGSETEVAYTFSGLNQIAVVGSVNYCIGVHFSDPGTGNVNISRANTAGQVKSDGDTYSDGPTATCSCTTSSNGPLDIYITYTEGVAGSNPVSVSASFEADVQLEADIQYQ